MLKTSLDPVKKCVLCESTIHLGYEKLASSTYGVLLPMVLSACRHVSMNRIFILKLYAEKPTRQQIYYGVLLPMLLTACRHVGMNRIFILKKIIGLHEINAYFVNVPYVWDMINYCRRVGRWNGAIATYRKLNSSLLTFIFSCGKVPTHRNV